MHEYLGLWAWDGTLHTPNNALFVAMRELAGKEASPTAAAHETEAWHLEIVKRSDTAKDFDFGSGVLSAVKMVNANLPLLGRDGR